MNNNGSSNETNALLTAILEQLKANTCMLCSIKRHLEECCADEDEGSRWLTISEYAKEHGISVNIDDLEEIEAKADILSIRMGADAIDTEEDGYGNDIAYREEVLDMVFSDPDDDEDEDDDEE